MHRLLQYICFFFVFCRQCCKMFISSRYFIHLFFAAFIGGLIFLLLPIRKPIGLYCPTTEISNHDQKDCVCSTNDTYLLAQPREMYTDDFGPRPSSLNCVMTIYPRGRLGNLMGEYATLLALSRLNGRCARLLPDMYWRLRDYFNLSIPSLSNDIVDQIPWTIHEIHDWMDESYKHFEGTFLKIRGYPCSWTFFHHLRDEIYKEFRFRDWIIADVQQYLESIKGKRTSVTFVGIHVRRGDYVDLMANRYDGVLADEGFLQKSTDYYRKKYPDAIFVVCSDDLEWVKKHMNSSNGDVFFGWYGYSMSPGKDMALLVQCNHSIISIGTFGFWVGYLTGGEVVYLTNYTRVGSDFHTFFKYDAAYLPDWIGIAANLTSAGNTTSSISSFCSRRFLVSITALISLILLQVILSIG